MATQATGKTLSLADVRDAIQRGDFDMEALMSSLADKTVYVRIGGNYRLLVRDGVSVVKGQFANCYKLSKDVIDAEGVVQEKKSRKKKTA